MKTVFSGVQPSGNLTIGNYIGAIKGWVKMQNTHKCIFSIVDMHALSSPQANNIAALSYQTLAIYLACGIDPQKSITFIQSHVSEHAELSWILQCITPTGWLNRMTQFKDKAGKNKEKANVALYTYPVLMAADILLYDAEIVPVGDDQTQHLELASQIALAFNRKYDVDCFTPPTALLHDKSLARIMSLRDGTKKMSKSDESDYSRVNILDTNDTMSKKISKAKTDSIDQVYYDPDNRKEISNLIRIYTALLDEKLDDFDHKHHFTSMKHFKSLLSDLLIEKIGNIRDKANQIMQDKTHLHDLATKHCMRAKKIASAKMQKIKNIVFELNAQ